MVNVFGQIPQQQPSPTEDPEEDDVKQAVAQMMAAQQANEPNPRPPTPDEADQIKRLLIQRASGMGSGGAAMPTAPVGPSTAPAPEPDQGPPLPPGMDAYGNTQPQLNKNDALRYMAVAGGAGIAPGADTGAPGALAKAFQGFPAVSPETVLGRLLTGNPEPKTLKALKNPPHPPKEEAQATPSSPFEAQPSTAEEDVTKAQMAQQPTATEHGTQVGTVGSLEPEHLKFIAEVAAPQAAQMAKAAVKDGIDTPEKAYAWAKAKFAGDPDIDKAIAEAKATYEQIKAVNDQPPSTGQIIGAILLGVLGVHPQVIQNVLHGNRSPQREQMAGESLLKLQLAKVAGLQHQKELESRQGPDSLAQARLDQQYDLARQHEEGMNKRADAANRLNEIKTAIENYRSLEEKKNADATRSIGKQKQQLIMDANEAKKARAFYEDLLRQEVQKFNLPKPPGKGAQIGQPTGGPTSMAPSPVGGVSPSAARLLGMGA